MLPALPGLEALEFRRLEFRRAVARGGSQDKDPLADEQTAPSSPFNRAIFAPPGSRRAVAEDATEIASPLPRFPVFFPSVLWPAGAPRATKEPALCGDRERPRSGLALRLLLLFLLLLLLLAVPLLPRLAGMLLTSDLRLEDLDCSRRTLLSGDSET